MIQPTSMSEALQRALMGLGGIGTAIEDHRKNQSAIAAQDANTATTNAALPGVAAKAGQDKLSFESAMRSRQILDSIQKNTSDIGQADQLADGSATPGQFATGPGSIGDAAARSWAPGQASPDQYGQVSQKTHDDNANLLAQWYRENGKPEATPDLIKAQQQAELTKTQNAGTRSNQEVIAGQQGIDSGAIDLSSKRATQDATIENENLAPKKTRAGIAESLAQANKDNADAGKANMIAKSEGADTDGLAKGLTTGDVNWDEFKTIMSSRGPEGAAARLAVFNKAMKIDPNFNPTEMEKSWKAYSNQANQTAIAQINNVKPNLKTLVDLSNQISRTGLPAVNKMILGGKYQIGDKTVTNFDEMKKAVSDELGIALSGKGQMTDEKLRLAQSMLNADPSSENYASNIDLIDHMLDTRKGAITKPMGVYAKRFEPDSPTKTTTAQSITKPEEEGAYQAWKKAQGY